MQNFSLRISFWGGVMQVLMVGGASGVILNLDWPFAAHALGMVGVGILGALEAWKTYGPSRVVGIKKQSTSFLLETARKEIFPVTLQPHSFVSPFLLVLHFKRTDIRKSRSVIIFPDSLRETEQRHLRVMMRFLAT